MQVFGKVVDYSWSKPGAGAISYNGYLGAMRYLGSDQRCITKSERDELLNAGLGIGLIWETTANRPMGGQAAGLQDGQQATYWADQLGAPDTLPIFAAVDFEPSDVQIAGPITDYFNAFKLASYRPVRPYGTYRVIEHLTKNVGISTTGWQCAAWSYWGSGTGGSYDGYRLSDRACMFQRVGYVLANTCDENIVFVNDFLWTARGGPSLPQQPTKEGVPLDMPTPVFKHVEPNPDIWRPVIINGQDSWKRIGGPDELLTLHDIGVINMNDVRYFSKGQGTTLPDGTDLRDKAWEDWPKYDADGSPFQGY